MATAKRTVQKPGAASTAPAPATTTENTTPDQQDQGLFTVPEQDNTAAQTDAAPAQATTPNALTPPIAAGSLVSASTDVGGAYLPESLADDGRSELERLRAENLALKQQQAAQLAIATKVTGPAPTAPAPVNQSKGGGRPTEHGWIVD